MASIDDSKNKGKSRKKACEECRRLKLGCEKIFPCESCQKRGCAAICPKGSFMKGTRSLKTSAPKLNENLLLMTSRIRELENAITDAHASVSTERHPVLRPRDDDDDPISSPIQVAAVPEPPVPIGETSDELSQVLGTLTIRSFRDAQFHGETAASEFLLHLNSDMNVLPPATQWNKNTGSRVKLAPDLMVLSVLFPFPPSTSGERVNIDRFQVYIPTLQQALHLLDVYYINFAWCSMPITRRELDETIISKVYLDDGSISLQNTSLQELSLLFMIFALGSLFDVDKPLYPSEAEEYHSLARAALCGEQMLSNTSLDCVRSMTLMSWYMMLCRRRSKGYVWAFSGLLCKLVQAIGLHREAGKGEPTLTLRKQTTFWEYITGDIWQAFNYGRPSSMVFSQIDCKKPKDLFGISDQTTILFYTWKYSFVHLAGDVLAQITCATQMNYRDVLELADKLREFPLPAQLDIPEPGSLASMEEVSPTLYLQRYAIRLWRHGTLLAIHRRFFMIAIQNDISKSQFSKSVNAVYDSACTMISDIWELYEKMQPLLCRMQPFWSYAFSAAIVLGALVMRCPYYIYAVPAMTRMQQACRIFADTEAISVQPPKSLETLRNIERRAQESLEKYQRIYMRELQSERDTSRSDRSWATMPVSSQHWSSLSTLQGAAIAAPRMYTLTKQIEADYGA